MPQDPSSAPQPPCKALVLVVWWGRRHEAGEQLSPRGWGIARGWARNSTACPQPPPTPAAQTAAPQRDASREGGGRSVL